MFAGYSSKFKLRTMMGELGGTGMPGGHARVSLSFTVGQPALKKSIS